MALTPAQNRFFAWLALFSVAGLLLWYLGPVLTPFIIGAVAAYVLYPLVERLSRRGVPHILAVLIVEIVALVTGLLLMLLLVPVLVKEIPQIKAQIPALLDALDQRLSPWLAQFGIHVSLDLSSLRSWFRDMFDAKSEDWVAAALQSMRIGGSLLVSLIGNLVLMPVVLFYLLHDWEALLDRVKRLVPPRLRPPVFSFFKECDEMLSQYLRGQLLVMGLLAAYYSIALSLAGFDLALPVGIFTGLAVFIPYIGFGMGLVLAILVGMLQFGVLPALGWVALIYGFGQIIESFWFTPYLVGERIGLSPLAVIFALMAFGQLFGFTGVLLALPFSALTVVALRRIKEAYLSSPLFLG